MRRQHEDDQTGPGAPGALPAPLLHLEHARQRRDARRGPGERGRRSRPSHEGHGSPHAGRRPAPWRVAGGWDPDRWVLDVNAGAEPYRCGSCGALVPPAARCRTCVAPLSSAVVGCRVCAWRDCWPAEDAEAEAAAHRAESGHTATWVVAGAVLAEPLWG